MAAPSQRVMEADRQEIDELIARGERIVSLAPSMIVNGAVWRWLVIVSIPSS